MSDLLRIPLLALLLTAALALPAQALHAQQLDFPELTGRVVDRAELLDPATESRLSDMLAAHEKASTEQLVVVTLPNLQGASIEQYGYQLGRHWGIGQAEKDNGALLIVAPNERKVRIEVGYGLEGRLTDAQSSVI
ncbi:MAG TPA: TPM domain-containing protein, partial [Halomonas sp.]|nr:TPM domain-containing protein [Halomonas sp.]